MTLNTFRISSLSLAAAAFLTIGAASVRAQNTYPNYPNGAQQPNSYPQQNNQQPGYPNANQQPNGYPDQNTYPNRDQRDRDGDRNRDRVAENNGPHNWSTDQIITATVHQAWILSGKNEANFFEIVRELAEISARNRNLILPDDPTSGRRAGEYIKQQARADHDQLLYAIVDKSVQMTGTRGPNQGN
jgi:hypothetical protein